MIVIEFFRDTLSGIYYFVYVAIVLFIIMFLLLRVSSLKKKEKEEQKIVTTVPKADILVEAPSEPVVEQKNDIPSIFMQQKAINEKYKDRFNNNSQNKNGG